MTGHNFVLRVVCFTAVVSAAGCSAQSPAAPSAAPQSSSRVVTSQTATTGVYEILFLKEGTFGLEPVVDNTVYVGEYLVLKAQVTDAAGAPATEGRVTYEYCSVDNVKVQSSECASGRGRWKRLWSMDVDPVGSLFGFGACSMPRTIGFRLRYGGGGNIADGVSAPKDVTWQ